jgi:hypothetical protein
MNDNLAEDRRRATIDCPKKNSSSEKALYGQKYLGNIDLSYERKHAPLVREAGAPAWIHIDESPIGNRNLISHVTPMVHEYLVKKVNLTEHNVGHLEYRVEVKPL